MSRREDVTEIIREGLIDVRGEPWLSDLDHAEYITERIAEEGHLRPEDDQPCMSIKPHPSGDPHMARRCTLTVGHAGLHIDELRNEAWT